MRFVVLITFKVTAGLIHPALLSGFTLVEWFGMEQLLTENLHGSGLGAHALDVCVHETS